MMIRLFSPAVRTRTCGGSDGKAASTRRQQHAPRSSERVVVPRAQPAEAPVDDSESPKMEDMVWDPQNLMKGGKLGKGHIEKRLAERRARQQADGPRKMVLKLPEDTDGPVFIKDAQEQFSFNGKSFVEHMKETYLPINPKLHERTQVLNLDPPVFVVENLIPSELCDGLREVADECGQMARSRLGGGLSVDESMPVSERRTSSSMLIGKDYSNSPKLLDLGEQVQRIIKGVFDGGSWGPPCTVPKSGSLVFEGLQVAKYEQGEYFLSHEDGFPRQLAEENKFQRRATVLLYLNDVSEGGATLFDWLGVSVKPQKGKALIFFPSFASGLPDDRTLHSAQGAVDQKWVAQQWVAAACKAQKPAPVDPLSAAAGRAALMKAGVGRSKAATKALLGKGPSKGIIPQGGSGAPASAESSGDTVSDVSEETAAELKAKASINKRKRKQGQTSSAGKSKGFGS